ncbi:MAG TPA: DUF4838 domain-containing protein [Candidatus Ratteibacteria bacterium]|nr:DUF4838 domain-containing protein [Candidatus Ratteibacteria bacterium]
MKQIMRFSFFTHFTMFTCLFVGLFASGILPANNLSNARAADKEVVVSHTNTIYGGKIIITREESINSLILAPAVKDLQAYLQQMTGVDYTISNDTSQGIILILTSSPDAPKDAVAQLKDKGLEAFIIRGDSSKLQIIANDVRRLSHGIYFYLEQLGVRWLMAGANWTVVPVRRNITLTINQCVTPDFFARGYYGTGGFYSNALGRNYTGSAETRAKGISEFEIEWTAWSRRMRNGGQSLGHAMGEAFISDPKITSILKEHPEYLAKIDGKYTPLFCPAFHPGNGAYVWDQEKKDYVKAVPPGTGTHDLNVIAKLNAGNPDAVELYANWIMERLRAARKGPEGYAIQTISVEPSDGTGEGNNYEELKAQGVGDGSESDQEFYIANYCARKVRAEFPDVSVVMLAYAQRSDPPTFDLEPNFIVQPAFAFRYGKKTAGLSNEEWIAAWKLKARNMAIYDYWSIPDWSHDEPTFNYLDMAKNLRYFYNNNIKGIQAESTFSGGAMGIGQYVASHLMWDINLDEKALIDDWYENAFGPAKKPMKRMLERWAQGYRPISSELGVSYKDIYEAEQLAKKNPDVLNRVYDYARYLHYLRLRNEFLNTTDAAEKTQKASVLAEYIFDINNSRMVHTTRAFDLLAFRGYPSLIKEFSLSKQGTSSDNLPDGPGWLRVHPLTNAEVSALITDGMKKYPLPDFEVKVFTGNLVPLQPIIWKAPSGDPWGVVMSASSVTLDLQIPEGLAVFPLRVSRSEDNKITVTDNAGRTIYIHNVTKSDAKDVMNDWDEMNIPLAPGHYHLNFAGKSGRLGLFKFQTWKDIPLIVRIFQNQKWSPSPRLYFYVPSGLHKIAIYFPGSYRAGGFEIPIYLPNGERAKVEERDNGKLVVVPVPEGTDGKVWSLEKLIQPYFNFEMLNVPQAFSLSPSVLMVPEDALKQGLRKP